MLSPVITGKVEKGKFIPDSPEVMKKAFHCHEGRRVSFCPKRIVKRRSDNQNRFYWGVVVPKIADYMGERDHEEVHAYLKAHFNYKDIFVEDKKYRVAKSTTKLSTQEFEDYIERVKEFAAKEMGLYIPNPNEVEFD